MAVRQYERACEKLESSQRLEPAPGTLLNLGRCYEALGRTQSAWVAFNDAYNEARRRGDELRSEVARDFRAQVEERLTRLRIVVPEPVEQLRIEHAGRPLERAAWGTAFPVDPGRHRVTAQAAGYEGWAIELDVVGAARTVEVVIPRLQREPARLLQTPVRNQEPPSSLGSWKWLPAGAAASAFAVCGALGLSAWSSWNEAESLCDGGSCPDQAYALAGRAESRANFATLSCGLGVLAGGAFVWLWVSDEAGPEPQVRAGLGLAPGQLQLGGRF